MDHDSHFRIHFGVGIPISLVLVLFLGYSVVDVVIAFVLWLSFASSPDVDQKLPLFSHRGFSHTVWAAAFLGYVTFKGIILVGEQFASPVDPTTAGLMGMAVSASWLLHIVEDMLTVGGGFSVKPFDPLSSANFSIGFLRSDSMWFGVFSWGIVVGGLVVVALILDFTGFIDLTPVEMFLRNIF